jgi:hypothetical protein
MTVAATPAAAEQPTSIEEVVLDRFERDTPCHKLTVLHDDGVYRHLRFMGPGAFCYFDIVTWPGHLSIGGDCEDFVFERTHDMFDFFSGDKISPQYWAEKIVATCRAAAETYSHDLYVQAVERWLEDVIEHRELDDDEATALRSETRMELLEEPPHDERAAVEAMMDFQYKDIHMAACEPYEWRLREWDFHFLWCCWAIVHGIAAYRLHRWK